MKNEIEMSRLYLILKIFALFLVLLLAGYWACGIYFRLVRDTDLARLDWICGISAIGSCFLLFRKLIRSALQEGIPRWVITLYFLFFTVLLGFFLRFSLQLANGWLDRSDPETQVVVVTGQKISPFGGSFDDGINPLAYMVYFQDWEDDRENCELKVTMDLYYSVDAGSGLELAVRKGFFHWPWVESYQAYKTPRSKRPQTL